MNLVTGNSEELLKRLEQREIDMAILLRPSNSEQYQMKRLKKQPFVVIIPTSWLPSVFIARYHVGTNSLIPFYYVRGDGRTFFT